MGEMTAIRISSHSAATARCEAGDWSEDAPDSSQVEALLSNGAMHAMTFGHRVHEHVDRDVTVDPQ
jgi:hypothetical protein